jgi:hypothetical protein
MPTESRDTEVIRVVLGREVEIETVYAVKRRTVGPVHANEKGRISLLGHGVEHR